MEYPKAGGAQAEELYQILNELTETLLRQDERIKTLEKALMAVVDNVALNRQVVESHQSLLKSQGLIP